MSSILHIDGIAYHPAPVAAKRLGYSKEYLLMLAKQSKILGTKIANKWYINESSAEEFFKTARDEQKGRREEVSVARKQELDLHAKDRAVREKRARRVHHRSRAILETVAIFVVGILLGTGSFMNLQGAQEASVATASNLFNSLSLSFYNFVMPEETIYVTNKSHSENAQANGDAPWTGALVESPARAVQDSFSDNVAVSFDTKNPLVTVVTPIFKDGRGEAQRFLLTPITSGTTSKDFQEITP